MTNHVGLDVSQKTTVLCVVDGGGHHFGAGNAPHRPIRFARSAAACRSGCEYRNRDC